MDTFHRITLQFYFCIVNTKYYVSPKQHPRKKQNKAHSPLHSRSTIHGSMPSSVTEHLSLQESLALGKNTWNLPSDVISDSSVTMRCLRCLLPCLLRHYRPLSMLWFPEHFTVVCGRYFLIFYIYICYLSLLNFEKHCVRFVIVLYRVEINKNYP